LPEVWLMSELKRTPLFEVYRRHGARLVDFGGWELPVQFSGIKEEHLAVRNKAGIFDVSHMGEIRVSGQGAPAFIQYAATNDAARMERGGSLYSAILNESGGFIDDVFIYCMGEREFLLCVNAANARRDFEWLSSISHPECDVIDESDSWAQIAVQGPESAEIVGSAAGIDLSMLKRLHHAPLEIAGADVVAARTGYTGEDGFELFVPAGMAIEVWDALMEAGGPRGLLPCGLGARDTLRLEMGYPLHGHDITDEITPIEADLEWIVAMYKDDFVGREALAEFKKNGIARKRVGILMQEAGVPRDGYGIVAPHGEGRVTSGTKTPCLDSAIAMGYVPAGDAADGTRVQVEIRGKFKSAVVSKWPFYRGAGKTKDPCSA
jgi:aminomethyltransferase